MSFPVQEFWKLAIDSQVLSAAQCQALAAEFQQQSRQAADAATLAKWLVSRQALTRYQAKVLLARRAGPFVYGDYKLIDRHETGRLAGVFRAEHIPTGHRVSLFFLSGASIADPQTFASIAQQCAAAAHVRQPHVARVYQLVDLGSYKFIVLADLNGASLAEQLATSATVPAPEACRLARQAALGVAALHQAGLVHGEVRPDNLWLAAQQQLQVLHLPLSRDPAAPPSVPHAAGISPQQLQAAAGYLAPELLAPGRWPDARSDVYALGCTLYRLLTGRGPHGDGDWQTQLKRSASEEPAAVNSINPQVPAPVAQVVGYMLAKDPAARYQQAAHVAEALLPYLDPRAAQVPPEQPAATSRAYEQWLEQQPAASPPRAAAVAAPVTTATVATAAAAGSIPMAQPVMAAQAGAIPTAAPVAVPAAGFAPQGNVAVEEAAPAIPAVTPSSSGYSVAAQRKAQQRAARRNMLFAAVAVLLLVGVGVGVVYVTLQNNELVATGGGGSTAAPTSGPGVAPPTGGVNPVAAVDQNGPATPAGGGSSSSAGGGETIASVDAEPMWQSPTSGEPLDLSYFPAGARAFLAIRPAEIWENEEALRVLTSLEIEKPVREQLTRLAGTPPENIEQAIFGFGGAGAELYLVARTKESVDEAELLKNWGASEPVVIADKRVFKAGGMAFYTPGEHRNKVIVAVEMSDDKQIENWLATAKANNTLRDLEGLRRASDARRHGTLLFSPAFFTTSGRELFDGPLEALKDPLLGFLTSDLGTLPHACLASVHLGPDLFGELRLSPDAEPQEEAKQLRQRVQGLTERMYEFVSGTVSPYSAPILQRFPRWLEELDRYTRAGTSGKQVVVRSYLPPIAAHNLAFGAKLALLESSGSGSQMVTSAPPAATPKSLADMLKQNYSLSFDRDSLDRTLNLMSTETGIPIVILGGDLQLEGITKNQSFGLDEKDKPIGEILRTVLLKANPDGKLIYVFGKQDGKEVLQITTRAAAAKRGDTIPPELAK